MERPEILMIFMAVGFALGWTVMEDRHASQSLSLSARNRINNGTFDRDTYCGEVVRLAETLNAHFLHATDGEKKSPFVLNKEGCLQVLEETAPLPPAP